MQTFSVDASSVKYFSLNEFLSNTIFPALDTTPIPASARAEMQVFFTGFAFIYSLISSGAFEAAVISEKFI